MTPKQASVFTGVFLVIMCLAPLTVVVARAPPPQYNPPVFQYYFFDHDYFDNGEVSDTAYFYAECKVTWDPHTIARLVYVYVDGMRYRMSYNIHTQVFSKTIPLSSTTHSAYIRALEIIDWDYISFAIYSNTYHMSPPADSVSQWTSAMYLGLVTYERTFTPMDYEWIEPPTTDEDWFQVDMSYTWWSIDAVITPLCSSLDVKLSIYYPMIVPIPGGGQIIIPTLLGEYDEYGRGAFDGVEGWINPALYGSLYFAVSLGGAGGCGAYSISISFEYFSPP